MVVDVDRGARTVAAGGKGEEFLLPPKGPVGEPRKYDLRKTLKTCRSITELKPFAAKPNQWHCPPILP